MSMPIYEYRCADCRRRVSLFYQTFTAASGATPTCPNCGSTNLSRLVSRVFQLKSEDAQLDDLADPSSFAIRTGKTRRAWRPGRGSSAGRWGEDWGEAGAEWADGSAPADA